MIKTKSKQIIYVLLSVVLVSAFIVLQLITGGAAVVRATTNSFTDVMADLELDSDFNAESYAVDDNDYSVQVIQIAESTDGELLIYVYTPRVLTEITATGISISTGIDDNAKWSLYRLTLLSRNGVFAKYSVKNFALKSNTVRYYNISEIYRKWDRYFDPASSTGDTISEVAFEVSQLWTVYTSDGEVQYHCLTSNSVVITQCKKGYIRFSNGTILGLPFVPPSAKYVDCYFVAFSADVPIERLYEADVGFITRSVHQSYLLNALQSEKLGDPEENEVTVTYTEKTTNGQASGVLSSNRYTWDRLMSVEELLASDVSNEISDSVKEDISDMDWVLFFYESEVSLVAGGLFSSADLTRVSDVTILRLKYETEGTVYNLGVVDNRGMGGMVNQISIPSASRWKVVIIVIVAVVVLGLSVFIVVKLVKRGRTRRR